MTFIFPSNVFVYNKSLTINNSSGVSLFYHCFYPVSTAYKKIVPFFSPNYYYFFQINRFICLWLTSARCVNNSISSLFFSNRWLLSALDTDRFPRFSPPGCDSYCRWWPGTSFKSRLRYENVLTDKVRGALKVRKLFWCLSRFDDVPFLCTYVRRRRMPTGLAQTGGNRCSKIAPTLNLYFHWSLFPGIPTF